MRNRDRGKRGQHPARAGVLLIGLLLAACTPEAIGRYRPPAADLPPKRLSAEYVPFTHVVRFATDRAEIDENERQRLIRFLDLLPPPDGAVVRIRGHADERLGGVYNADLAARRARNVAAMFARRGYSAIELTTASFGEAVPVGGTAGESGWRRDRRVEITVQVPMITLPDCPDWSAPSDLAAGNLAMSQLGCANALNLAATIANPADLVGGRSLAGADGTREAAAIERYHSDKVKKLIGEEQKKKAAGK